MNLPYRKILKQAYQIVWNNKFLWIFGLFLFFGTLFNAAYFFQTQNTNPTPSVNDFSWFQTHIFLGNLTLVIILAIILELFLLYFKAKAGNIIGVKAIFDKQETSFVKSFHFAGFFHMRLFGLSLAVQFTLALLGILIGGPVLYLLSIKFFTRALILGILGIIILIPVSILAIFISLVGPMFVVLHDLKIGEAIKSSFELISQFWLPLLLFSFMLWCLSLLAFFLSSFAAAIIASPFVFLAYLAYHSGSSHAGAAMAITAIPIIAIVFLTIEAAVAAFVQTAWVLAFLELIKTQKFEEEEPLPLPEVI